MTEYIIGTHNMNGEEYVHCNSEDNAKSTIENLIEEGFGPGEIVVYEISREVLFSVENSPVVTFDG